MKRMSGINLHFTGLMFGVGASVDDEVSLEKINRLKQRPQSKSFIVLLESLQKLSKYVEVDSKLSAFLGKFWPGPLTVVLACKNLPHLSQNGCVAFRVPIDEFLRSKLNAGEIVSTSVNCSGEEPLVDVDVILSKYSNWFDENWVPSGVTTAKGTPSTIVKIEGEELVCLREGALDFAAVRREWTNVK